VEVVRAISPGVSVAAAARLIDSLSPVIRSSRETLTPLRGRNPWFASVFNMGQGLRPNSESDLESSGIRAGGTDDPLGWEAAKCEYFQRAEQKLR
jgi:hypothetical protein